ncbi:hypothetical protein K501DRAFT_286008 [Backusella circina FSU 941]|nr:hypothetical protein K501DRAFT_286008 [Backusella circina FSU 941]
MAEEEEATTVKRKRLSLACEVCRRKKIKCDGLRPTCGKCERLHLTCTYSTTSKKRGPRQGHMELLERRLQKMEQLITNTEEPTLLDTNPTPTTIATSGNNNNSTAATLISLQTQPVTTNTTSNTTTNTATASLLPPVDVVFHLVDLFFSQMAVMSPIINRSSFYESIENNTCSPFLLLAILSVGARYSKRPDITETPVWMSGEKYATKARDMIAQVIDTPSIEHVQGLLVLTLNEYGCARGPRSWMYTGIAARMALELGLNKETMLDELPGTLIPIDQWYRYETRRKVFWETFIHDKFSSASTGRPGCLDPSDCDILLPCDYDVLSNNTHFYQETHDQSMILFYNVCRDATTGNMTGVQFNHVDPKVPENRPRMNQIGWEARILKEMVILGDVIQLVNRGYKNKTPFATYAPDSEFTKLDEQLDHWGQQLPLNLRNTPANLERYRRENTQKSASFVLAHTLHNSLIVLLNRPSLVLADMPEFETASPQIKHTINQSVDKCLAAADDFTLMLKDLCCRTENVPPFTIYLAYTIGTVMVNNSFSVVAEQSQKAEYALREFFSFLERMRGYWAMADKLYFMIRDLYAVHRKVLEECKLQNHNGTLDSPWNESNRTSSPSSNLHDSPLMETRSTIPPRRLPLADMSHSTSDWAASYPWQAENENNSSGQVNRGASLFKNTYDQWMQRQQE